MKRYDQKGITLVELAVVIFIITILIGLLTPAIRAVREHAKEQKARAMIGALETAINMYYLDNNAYPPEAGGGTTNNFNTTLGTVQSVGNVTYGPYMEFKAEELSGDAVLDPWQSPYRYDVNPAQGNNATFNLEDGSNKNIRNW